MAVTLPIRPVPNKIDRKPLRAPERKEADGMISVRSYALRAKAADDGTFEGYASVFGVRDQYDDIIVRGAFLATLAKHKADGTMPAMLWQHDEREPIGVWESMAEDDSGLHIKGRLALGTARGKEAHELLKMGALTGLSIGFVAVQSDHDRESGVRTLTEIDLWEVSLVTFPANGSARVTGVKSADMATPKDAERALRDAGFSKSCATGFVSRVMRMGEARRESACHAESILKSAKKLLESMKK